MKLRYTSFVTLGIQEHARFLRRHKSTSLGPHNHPLFPALVLTANQLLSAYLTLGSRFHSLIPPHPSLPLLPLSIHIFGYGTQCFANFANRQFSHPDADGDFTERITGTSIRTQNWRNALFAPTLARMSMWTAHIDGLSGGYRLQEKTKSACS